MHRLGDRVRACRNAAGMTQTELAYRAEITPRYVQLIEAGRRRNLTMASLCRLADALGVTSADLLSDD